MNMILSKVGMILASNSSIIDKIDLQGSTIFSKFQAMMIYDISGLGLTENVNDIMNGMTSYDDLWKTIDSFSTSIKLVASMLLMIHFLCYILEAVTREQVSTDIFFKGFIKFIIGFFLVQNANELFKLLMLLGNQLGDEFTATAASRLSVEEIEYGLIAGDLFCTMPDLKGNFLSGDFLNQIKECFEAIINIIVCIPTTLLFWLLAKATVVIIAVLLVTRTLELAVRALFSPIAIVDVFEHGTNGSGFKYIKKFLAVAIQGAVIMAIMIMVGTLSGLEINDVVEARAKVEAGTISLSSDYSDAYSDAIISLCQDCTLSINNLGKFFPVIWFYLKSVVFMLAGVGLSMKSQQVCNDIIGV